jgi:hypothetical protein
VKRYYPQSKFEKEQNYYNHGCGYKSLTSAIKKIERLKEEFPNSKFRIAVETIGVEYIDVDEILTHRIKIGETCVK